MHREEERRISCKVKMYRIFSVKLVSCIKKEFFFNFKNLFYLILTCILLAYNKIKRVSMVLWENNYFLNKCVRIHVRDVGEVSIPLVLNRE